MVLSCQRSRFFLGNSDVSVNQISVMSEEGALHCNVPVRTIQKKIPFFGTKLHGKLYICIYIFLFPIISVFYLPEYSRCSFLCSLSWMMPLGKENKVYNTYNHTAKQKLTSCICETFPLKFNSGDSFSKNRLHAHFLWVRMQCHTVG